jgi:hypothetical protein
LHFIPLPKVVLMFTAKMIKKSLFFATFVLK